MAEAGVKLRPGIVLAVAASLVALAAAPAQASITIGQLSDPGISNCVAGYDIVAVRGASPTTYTVPAKGTIVSWTMFASAMTNQQVAMKVFRKIGEPSTYEVVGRAELRTLTPGGTAGNTFPASIAVKPGDLLGLHANTAANCLFAQGGAAIAVRNGDLPVGQSDSFPTLFDDTATDLQATLVPDNGFSVAGTKRDKKKGTATLSFKLPNAGELTGSGKGAKVASAGAGSSKSVPAGAARLLVKAKGKKKAKLNDTGKIKLRLGVTYTPTGGDPSTQSLKVKLLKR